MNPSSPCIVYIHGFNSSPKSYKANVLRHWIEQRQLPVRLEVPQLPYAPARAATVLENLIRELGERPIGLIGSSLGGYYATWLTQRFGLPAALVNPAVRPYELLGDYLGENLNPYTGERYQLGPEHLEQLVALDVPEPGRPDRLFLLVQSGDQTLDYRQAVRKFPGSKAWIEAGGSHEFQGFERALPAIFDFFGFPLRPASARA